MNSRLTSFIISIITYTSCESQSRRESILDRQVTIQDSIILDLPEPSRLCDELGIKGKKTDIGGVSLYVETRGSGVPVVLIHGGPGGTHHYFHPHFSPAEKFSKVIYYDQRGCGLSDFNPGNGYSFEQAADDLEALRRALQLEKWIVMGYSYGGAVAQFYAIKYPERLLGMILVGSHPVSSSIRYDAERQYAYMSPVERSKINEIASLYRHGKLTVAQRIFNARLNGDWKRQSFYKPTQEEITRTALYEWVNDEDFNSIVSTDVNSYTFDGAFVDCPLPILLMEGKYDLTFEEGKIEKFHNNMPSAELVVFENSGHNPFSEEPEKFFDEMEEFVKNLSPASGESIRQWKKSIGEMKLRK